MSLAEPQAAHRIAIEIVMRLPHQAADRTQRDQYESQCIATPFALMIDVIWLRVAALEQTNSDRPSADWKIAGLKGRRLGP